MADARKDEAMSKRSVAGSGPFRDDPLKDAQECDPETGGRAGGVAEGGTAEDRRAYRRALAGNKPSAKVEPGMGSTAGARSRRGAAGEK